MEDVERRGELADGSQLGATSDSPCADARFLCNARVGSRHGWFMAGRERNATAER